jgi:hypothetical protein
MADYTLKLYREDSNASPGKLIGKFAFAAADNAEAILHATTSFAAALRKCDYAIIGGMYGRVVWEKGRPV